MLTFLGSVYFSGVNEAVQSQIFTYNVKIINDTGYDVLTWKEVLDQNSTKCKLYRHVFLSHLQRCVI